MYINVYSFNGNFGLPSGYIMSSFIVISNELILFYSVTLFKIRYGFMNFTYG